MKLYRAFATVGGFTMVSRVLGFVRDMMIAAVLGSGLVADAFFVAFRFPNLFRRLLGEGAFNSAFVPLFAKHLECEGQSRARRFAEEAMAGLLFVLLVLTAVAELAMPWIMPVFAPGFTTTAEKLDLSVLLARITFPYLLCMSLVAMLSGVLNALGRFTAAAAAPALLNVLLISALLLALSLGLKEHPQASVLLAWGVAIAGLAQLLMLLAAVRRAGFPLRFRMPVLDDDIRRLVALGIPGIISGGVTQLNIFIGTVIASLQAGAVSYLYYADRLYQLPLGIVGIAIGVVLLPDLSRKLAAGDHAAAHDSQNRALELALLLTLPASVALAVSAYPIVQVMFERGAFTAEDTLPTASALAVFAVGLPAFVLIKVFQPAFFAREDTKTPMRLTILNLAINAAGSVGLFYLLRSMGMMPHLGIAIATTVASWINAIMLWALVARHGHFEMDARARRNIALVILASGCMGLVLAAAGGILEPYFARRSGAAIQASALGTLVLAGMATYFGLLHVTRVARLDDLARRVLKRR